MDQENFDQLKYFAAYNGTSYPVIILMDGERLTASFKSASRSWSTYTVPPEKYQAFYDEARRCYFENPPGFALESWIRENCWPQAIRD